MAEARSTVVRRQVVSGVLAGILLATAVWLNSHTAGQAFVRSLPPVAAAAIGLPPVSINGVAVQMLGAGCVASAGLIVGTGFDPYAILRAKRQDVLLYYAANGWDLNTHCTQVFDDWTAHGAGEGPPTTPVAYVRKHGWAPRTRQPTPTPFAGCVGLPDLTKKLGFDPYRLLGERRPDVLRLYAANGWKPATQCVQIFDDWLQHPDGGPPATATAFVVKQGWARAH